MHFLNMALLLYSQTMRQIVISHFINSIVNGSATFSNGALTSDRGVGHQNGVTACGEVVHAVSSNLENGDHLLEHCGDD